MRRPLFTLLFVAVVVLLASWYLARSMRPVPNAAPPSHSNSETSASSATQPAPTRGPLAAGDVPDLNSAAQRASIASAPGQPLPHDFYNVLFSPVSPGTIEELVDRRETSIDFYIGPEQAAENAVPAGNAAVSTDVESRGRQTLTVTLSCAFCSGSRMQKEVVSYTPGVKSTDAMFKIVPDKRYTRRAQNDLVFEITGTDGIVYDNVVVPVSIVSATSAKNQITGLNLGPAPTDTVGGGHALGNYAAPPGARPVDLTITIGAKNNKITVQLDTENPSLSALFSGENLQTPGGSQSCAKKSPECLPREFMTSLTEEALSQELRRDYVRLAATVNQQGPLSDPSDENANTFPKLSASTTQITADDEKVLLEELDRMGGRLYRELFHERFSDPSLIDLMAKLDKYAKPDGKPLLLNIQEPSIYFPWQFLYPPQSTPGAVDPQRFWGFRYEIVVDPVGRLTPGYLPGPLQYRGGSTVFAKYHAGPTEDALVSSMGEDYAGMLSGVGLGNLKKAESKSDFIKILEDDRQSVEVVAIFTHATNDLQWSSSLDSPVPEMFLGQKDFVTVDDLTDMTSILPPEQVEFFNKQPLVFLNACETGVAGRVANGSWNFPTTFLNLGARGVIATEAPVWSKFAFDFGSSMMKTLRSTKGPVSLVLLQTRNDFLRNDHNPLGLLYSYYGGVDAALIVQ